MKKIKTIFLLTSIFAALIFAGCNNSVSVPQNDNPQTNNEVKGYSLKGGMDFNINAYPSELSCNTSSRMAMPEMGSISLDIDCTHSTVTGVHLTSGYKIKGVILYDEDWNEYFYEITLPLEGEWEIQLVVETGTMTFYGSDTVNIQKYVGGNVLHNESDDPEITLVPVITDGQTGSISLYIFNDVVTNEDRNYSVIWTWDQKPDTVEENPSIYRMPDNVLDSYFNEISFPNIPSGSYKVNITFKKDEKTLYSCDQWIHVFGDMITDTWYGSGPQYTQNGDSCLALTQEAIEFYLSTHQTESEKINSVFYKCTPDFGEIELGYVTGHDYSQKAAAIYPPEIQGNLPILNDVFGYGKDGIIYYVGTVYASDTNYYILEYAPDGSSNYYLFENPDSTINGKSSNEIKGIYYDNISDKLYIEILGKSALSSQYFPIWYDVKLDTDNHYVDIINTYSGVMTNGFVQSFVVQNGCLYFCEYNAGIYINCYALGSPEGMQLVWKNPIVGVPTDVENDPKHIIQITGMICTEGFIYILFNDNYATLGSLYSRGAVIKYGLFEQSTFIHVGIDNMQNDLFENEDPIYLYCSGTNNSVTPVYGSLGDLNNNEIYTLQVSIANYSPEYPDTEFYGPKKILSYDNQYLYIADYGKKYILGSDNKVSYEPVNRIVKFDYKNMRIDSIPSVLTTDSFVYPEGAVFACGDEGIDAQQDVFDDENHTYTDVYLYIPVKE